MSTFSGSLKFINEYLVTKGAHSFLSNVNLKKKKNDNVSVIEH